MMQGASKSEGGGVNESQKLASIRAPSYDHVKVRQPRDLHPPQTFSNDMNSIDPR